MNYRETVRSVLAFMGWNFIADIELDTGGTDSSNNPMKGKKNSKKTGKVSVEMPADDWLCQKMERLNCVAADGYPFRSQDAGVLRPANSSGCQKVKASGIVNIAPGRMNLTDRAGQFLAGQTMR